MYRLFVYGYSFETNDVYITDEYEFNIFEDALKCVVRLKNAELFEIARDVFEDVICLKTVARSASMRALLNTYYSRW